MLVLGKASKINNMSNSKFVAGLILGAAAGTFLAIFANTDKGKDMWDDVSTKGKDMWGDALDTADDWQGKAKSQYGDAFDEVSDLISKGKKYISQLEKKAKDIKDAATS